jgi:hypothetical protein
MKKPSERVAGTVPSFDHDEYQLCVCVASIMQRAIHVIQLQRIWQDYCADLPLLPTNRNESTPQYVPSCILQMTRLKADRPQGRGSLK